MYLGIVFIAICWVLGIIFLARGHDGWYFLIVLPGSIVGAIFLFGVFFNTPNDNDIRYSAVVEGKYMGFNSYSNNGNDIIVPSHYYKESSWINSWKYCDSPITIVVPDGMKVEIQDNAPKPQPRIVGGCKGD